MYSSERAYVLHVMFFFFLRAFSEVPRLIAVKLCHIIGNCLNFIMQVQKFGGAPPPPPAKKNGGKSMQNLGRFFATSDFDREYRRNGSRYPKSES